MKLSVLIPAYNEEDSVGETVREVYDVLTKENIPHEIIVINDHSTDRTEEILNKVVTEISSLRKIDNSFPNGFGYAVRCGLNHFKGDCVAIFMADASDSPDDLVNFYRALVECNYDAVFGSRFISGGKTVDYPPVKLCINRLANSLIRVLFGLKYNDITNAFKMYRSEMIKNIPIEEAGFACSMEITVKAFVRGAKITEVPTVWRGRTAGKSKFSMLKGGKDYLRWYVWALLLRKHKF